MINHTEIPNMFGQVLLGVFKDTLLLTSNENISFAYKTCSSFVLFA